MLKSEHMELSSSEKRWLPWFGKTGKISMRWATLINRRRYPILEQTFEGIAATRIQTLTGWANHQWVLLEGMAAEVVRELPEPTVTLMKNLVARSPDFSEIFVIDSDGRVIASSYPARVGASFQFPNVLQTAKAAAFPAWALYRSGNPVHRAFQFEIPRCGDVDVLSSAPERRQRSSAACAGGCRTMCWEI